MAVVLGVTIAASALVAALDGGDEPKYPVGECTRWAFEKRPELTRGTRGLDAADWERWAREHGFDVDARPRVGDIAVWARNVGGDADGHVAYVEHVSPEGDVFVSEANFDGCRDVSYSRLTPARLSTALFIHRKS